MNKYSLTIQRPSQGDKKEKHEVLAYTQERAKAHLSYRLGEEFEVVFITRLGQVTLTDKFNHIANHLRALGVGDIEPTSPGYTTGIRHELSKVFGVDYGFLPDFCNLPLWKHYSGFLDSPVPDTGEYDLESGWEGYVGELRRDLCLHCATQLEHMILAIEHLDEVPGESL